MAQFAWSWTDRELLYRESARHPPGPKFVAGGSCRVVMSPLLSSTFVAFLRQGGVGGAHRPDRRSWRAARFAQIPRGTDTARPAGH